MITYNISNNTIIPSEFTDSEGKLKDNLTPYEFLFDIEPFARVLFNKVYYAAFEGRFYAYKLIYITFEYNDLNGGVEMFYHIQLADGRIKKINARNSIFSSETFKTYSYLENYVRYGDDLGRGLDTTINMGELITFHADYGKFYVTEQTDDTNALRMHLYSIGLDGRAKEFCSTEFLASWIDAEGFHAYINDKDFFEGNNPLFENEDECRQTSRIVYDFDGVKHVEDIKLIDGGIYKVWCKETSTSYVFVKDSKRSECMTSCSCYCVSVESDHDEDYYHDDLYLDDKNVFNDEDVQFIDDASGEDIEKLKVLIGKEKNVLTERLSKNAQNSEEIANILAMFDKIIK